ncbi:MAG: YbjQ family protein [Acidimicrobiales bacterium]
MSDVSQGPGWWQASDGKWYPPETAPPGAAPPVAAPVPQLLMVTSDLVPGRTIASVLGLVSGSSVRAKHVGKDIGASFKNLVGGELKAYQSLMAEARDESIVRMLTQAAGLGADTIVAVRFTTSQIAAAAAEVYAYGTAVVLE